MNKYQKQIAKLLLLTYGNKFTRVDYITIRELLFGTNIQLIMEHDLLWQHGPGFLKYCYGTKIYYHETDIYSIHDGYLEFL